MNFKQNKRKGAVLILIAFGMVMLFGVAAVVIDLGRVYVEKNRVQEATEAAALAGGQELGRIVASGNTDPDSNEFYVKDVAMNYARKNGIDLEWNDVVVTNDRVYINKLHDVEYTFAKVLGLESKTVGGNAVAKVGADGDVTVIKEDRYNVMPWAMPHAAVSEPYNVLTKNVTITNVAELTPGNEYVLKLGGGPQAGGVYYPMGTQVLIPMGGTSGNYDQWNLGFKRAYGVAVWLAGRNFPVKWLLGYRGGSFMFDLDTDTMRTLGAMKTAGDGEFGSAGIFVDPNYFQWVKYEIYPDATDIINQTTSMIVVDQAPRIGVYSSGEDAVTRTMLDAGINYSIFYDDEIRAGCLANYDWLHLHHEDFTGGGDDGGAEVPYITITDEIDNPYEGQIGGVIKVAGSGFQTLSDGHENIKIWFHNTQMSLTDTSRYSTDFVHPDKMMVDADDNYYFEVTIEVPPLPDGTYRIYAQVLDEYTNYPEYTIVGSSIRPNITITDNVDLLKEGPYGGVITVEGGSFGPSTSTILVKFGGMIQSFASTTAKYPDDAISPDGFIVATPGGSFEVSFQVPSLGFPDGEYDVYAQLENATSNVELYTIQNYLNPTIAVADTFGNPVSGPDGGIITVSGTDYRSNSPGIRVQFAGSDMIANDTLTLPTDAVVGNYDITSDENGKWEVTISAPVLAAGDYLVQAYHTDPLSGPIVSNAVNYNLRDSSELTAEVYIHDIAGDPLSGSPGTRIIVEGAYFNKVDDDIIVWFLSTPIHTILTDTGKYPDSEVIDAGQYVHADSNGMFEVQFTVPEVPFGTHEVKVQYSNDLGASLYTDPVEYVVAAESREIMIYDDAEPFDRGHAGIVLTVEGWDYTPDINNLKLLFNGVVMTPWSTDKYADDGVNGINIEVNSFGSFEVQFRTPYIAEGQYIIQVTNDGTDVSNEYTYNIEMAEDFWTSQHSDFSTDDNAFVVDDTLYLMAMNTRVNDTMMANSYAKITDVYYGVERMTIPLSSVGNFHHAGQVLLSTIPNIHNGDWEIHFYLEDVMGARYEPTCVIHITGVSNVTEAAVISRNSDFSTDDVPLKYTERQYFKIQSPEVDYSDVKEAKFRFCSQESYIINGMESAFENTGDQSYTNNWDGTYVGNYQCPCPSQHYGDYVVKQYIEDNAGRKYEHMRNIVFFAYYSRRTLVSSYEYYNYETNNFYRYGNIYCRTFCRGGADGYTYVNYLDMATNEYKYKKYKSGSDPITDPAPLVNEGNMIFNIQENLGPYQSGTKYYAMKIYTYLKDNNNNMFYDEVYFNLRNTVAANPIDQMKYYVQKEGWSIDSVFTWACASFARELNAMVDEDSLMREQHVCFSNDEIYVDGRQDELSPRYYHGPKYIDGNEPVELPSHLSSLLKRDDNEINSLEYDVDRLFAEYEATPFDAETEKFWAFNEFVQDKMEKIKGLPEISSWFATPAHAVVYAGRYDIVHIIRNFVVNGGYMFTMCYATESIDITLARDDAGNYIGYDNTFAFQNFEGHDFDIRDSANFTIYNMENSGDEYDRPLAITQNHITTLPGFIGATTSFNTAYIKATTGPNSSPVYKCASISSTRCKYLGASYGDGWFTFLGGHDPRLIEVYRLILNNILIGSLASTIPTTMNSNYVVLDMDNVDNGEETDKNQYMNNIKFGYPPSLWGDIVTSYPGDLPENTLVDTLPYNFAEETETCVNTLIDSDMLNAEPGEIHTWRTPEAASSRYVLVPICSAFMQDGSTPAYSQPQNLIVPTPANIYEIRGRDKVRIMRYALFYLSHTTAQPHDDPDLNEIGTLKPGEIRGKFIGYLK